VFVSLDYLWGVKFIVRGQAACSNIFTDQLAETGVIFRELVDHTDKHLGEALWSFRYQRPTFCYSRRHRLNLEYKHKITGAWQAGTSETRQGYFN
jgi:hypothetical protein